MEKRFSCPLTLALICLLYMFIGVLGIALNGTGVVIDIVDGMSDLFVQMLLTLVYTILLFIAGFYGWKGKRNSWALMVLASLLAIAVNAYYNDLSDVRSNSTRVLIVLTLLYLLLSSKAKAYLNGSE